MKGEMDRAYTLDEIKKIKENLMTGFGTDRIPIDCNLYGLCSKKEDRYPNLIKKNKKFWFFVNPYFAKAHKMKKGWTTLTITFVRSGVYFFRYDEYPEHPEDHMEFGCSTMANDLYPVEFDMKDCHTPYQNYPLLEYKMPPSFKGEIKVKVFDEIKTLKFK